MPALTSIRHPAVKDARRLATAPTSRRGDAVLVEGPQAVREALGVLQRLFVSAEGARRQADLVAAAQAGGTEVLHVDARVLRAVADTVTPQGLVGVASVAQPPIAQVLADASLIVVVVQARDPGNVGTIVRTADAVGADAVVFSHGSVDPHNPKAVRASAGSLFHLPVLRNVALDDVLLGCTAHGIRLLATAATAAAAFDEVDLTRPTALLFGNEAHGLAADVVARCHAAVRVPIHGRAESLNLAATVAVIGYEAVRQRRVAATTSR